MRSRTSRELLIAAAALAAAFVALTVWVRFHGPVPGDGRVHDWAVRRGTPSQGTYDLYNLFGALGTAPGAALTILTAALILLRNVGARAAGLLLAAAAIALAERPLGRIIGLTDAAAAFGGPPGAFPSGHALYAASGLGMLAFLGREHGRPEVAAVSLTAILLIGITRVTSGAHLPDEVLGGYLLGAAWVCLLLGVSHRAPSRPARR